MLKILLIEDDDSNRDLISRYLRRFDCDVSVATDGLDGWQKVQVDRDNIDLVLMDMSLPGIDGWEVTRRLKSNELTKHLPVIALTAHAMTGDREKALAAGCNDYATKPIEFTKLFAKIEALCSNVCS